MRGENVWYLKIKIIGYKKILLKCKMVGMIKFK